MIYNSQSLQLVSHDPFTSTEEAIVNESDILSTTMLVEHKLSRKTVKDTDVGKKLLDEVDDLKSFKIAREIKEKIEGEMQYPGTIKITVIRETRAQEEAK